MGFGKVFFLGIVGVFLDFSRFFFNKRFKVILIERSVHFLFFDWISKVVLKRLNFEIDFPCKELFAFVFDKFFSG